MKRPSLKPEFVRFRDLTPEFVNRDFQVHTVATDGRGTIQELIDLAEEISLGEMAFTEHVRKTSTYFGHFAAEVRAARDNAGLPVFVGIEAKADNDDGDLDASLEILADAEIVLGSVHRFPIAGELVNANTMSYEEASLREFRLAMGLIRNAPIDVLSHPGGMCQRAFGEFPAEFIEEIMTESIGRGVAIEINSSYIRDMDSFLALCAKTNPLISVGSDVHLLEDLGVCRTILRDRGVA